MDTSEDFNIACLPIGADILGGGWLVAISSCAKFASCNAVSLFDQQSLTPAFMYCLMTSGAGLVPVAAPGSMAKPCFGIMVRV